MASLSAISSLTAAHALNHRKSLRASRAHHSKRLVTLTAAMADADDHEKDWLYSPPSFWTVIHLVGSDASLMRVVALLLVSTVSWRSDPRRPEPRTAVAAIAPRANESDAERTTRRPRLVVFLGWSGSLSSCLGIVASTQGVCLGLNIVLMRQYREKPPVCKQSPGLVSYMPLGWQQRASAAIEHLRCLFNWTADHCQAEHTTSCPCDS